MNEQYYDILNECLNAVMDNSATITECIARYPHYAESLRYDLGVATLLHHIKPPEMRVTEVDRLDARLQKLGKSSRGTIIAFPRWMSTRVAAILLVLIVTFAVSGGTVAASSNSLPGDPLYGIKRLWEAVIVAIAQIAGNVDEVYLQIAETRLDEAQRLAANGALEPAHLDALHDAISKAMTHVQPDTQSEFDTLVVETQTTLVSWANDSPISDTEQAAEPIFILIEPALQDLANRPQGGDAPVLLITATPTPSPTDTPSERPSATPTDTPSPVLSATRTNTPTLTPSWTPRYPPTATDTPTPSFTPDTRPTLTPTWTDYPTSTVAVTLPTLTPTSIGGDAVIVDPVSTATPRTPNPTRTASPTWYPWVDATYDACYLTRTAEPDSAYDNPYCP